MNALLNFVSSMLSVIPDIICAILLLVVAFFAAKWAKSLVTKALKAVHPEKFLDKLGVKEQSADSAIDFVAKLVYFVVFLLFLPAVLDKLGMHSVSSPITDMMYTFLAFVPKLVAAGLIAAVGIFVAKLVKQLLVPVLKALKVDALQEKAGIQAVESASFSAILANLVYAIILLVVITAALDQLGIRAVSEPANEVVQMIFRAIPYVFYAIVVVAAGLFIGKTVGKLLESVLAGVGTDKLAEKFTAKSGKAVSLSKLIGEIVKYVLDIIFVVQAINVLKLPVLTEVGASIIAFLPVILVTVIIAVAGVFAAKAAEAAIVNKFPAAKGAALAARAAIYVVTVFLCLSQLGVAAAIVETTFVLIVAALCGAFVVAFGVGGRKFAADALDKLEKKMENRDSEK